MVIPGRILRYFQVKRGSLTLIIASFLMLAAFSLSLLTGYYIGKETERKTTLFKSLEEVPSMAGETQQPKRCEDTKMMDSIRPQAWVKGIPRFIEAHCDGLIFKVTKPGFEEEGYVYSPPSECQLVSSLLSPDGKGLAFYVGQSPNYGDYHEDRCGEKGLYFFSAKTQEVIKGPPSSSIGTFLVPTFWSSDSRKVYCEVDRPYGEGCQPLEVIEIGDIKTQQTPICGYFFQNEDDPDDFIHLTSSENAPRPCYGMQIKDQIARFNAKTGENNILFESKNEENLEILEVFDNNKYILVEKAKDGFCDTAGQPSYFIFDTAKKTIIDI